MTGRFLSKQIIDMAALGGWLARDRWRPLKLMYFWIFGLLHFGVQTCTMYERMFLFFWIFGLLFFLDINGAVVWDVYFLCGFLAKAERERAVIVELCFVWV